MDSAIDMLMLQMFIIMTRYDKIITDNFLLESLHLIKTIFPILCFLKQSLTQCIIILKYSIFHKRFWRVTFKIAKFLKCLIHYHVKFEPYCSKIYGVMTIFVGKRILAGFFPPCSYSLFSTYCLLLATWYYLLATCYLLLAYCYLLFPSCYLQLTLFVACCLLLAACYFILATSYLLFDASCHLILDIWCLLLDTWYW